MPRRSFADPIVQESILRRYVLERFHVAAKGRLGEFSLNSADIHLAVDAMSHAITATLVTQVLGESRGHTPMACVAVPTRPWWYPKRLWNRRLRPVLTGPRLERRVMYPEANVPVPALGRPIEVYEYVQGGEGT